MRFATLALCSAITVLFSSPLAYAQSAADIQELIAKSKLVEIKHPVTAKVTGAMCDISTYCEPKTSNQDLKITALLMMKEISHHYKKILKIRVNFYEIINPAKYRTVWATQANVLALDSGNSATDAIYLLRVVPHNSSTSTKKKKRGGRGRTKDNGHLNQLVNQ